MNRLEKIKLAFEKGYTYNPDTGEIFGVKGKVITRKNKAGYIDINLLLNEKRYHLRGHHFAYYWVHGESPDLIDHINRKKDDNRIDNLRAATHELNSRNRQCKGYSFSKDRNKFLAKIKTNSKHIHLGYFDTEEEAREEYLKAKKIYHPKV